MTGADKARAMIETAFEELANRLGALAESLPDDEDNPIGSDAFWIRETAGEVDGMAEGVSEDILLHGAVNAMTMEDLATFQCLEPSCAPKTSKASESLISLIVAKAQYQRKKEV